MIRARGSHEGCSIPVPGTSESHTAHLLFFLISAVMMGVLGAVLVSMVYSVVGVVYRPHRLESHSVEWWWTVGPMVIVLMVALPTLVSLYWGGGGVVPTAAVMAVGHQWYWEFQQSWGGEDPSVLGCDSYTETNPEERGLARLFSTDAHLLVPMGCVTRVMVTSADVVHNFNLKSMSVSMDAVPGRCHTTSVSVNSPGLYSGLCSEVCGPGHYSMALTVEAVSLAGYWGFFSGC